MSPNWLKGQKMPDVEEGTPPELEVVAKDDVDELNQVCVGGTDIPWMKPDDHLGSCGTLVVEIAESDKFDCHAYQHRCGSVVAVCRNWHDGQIPDSGNIAE